MPPTARAMAARCCSSRRQQRHSRGALRRPAGPHRRPTVWLHDAGDGPSQPVLYREPPNTRKAAYDRRTDGPSHDADRWVDWKAQRQFEAAHPEHRKRNGESRIAFDRWLERLK